MQQMSNSSMISVCMIIHPLSKCVPSFNSLDFTVTEKSMDKGKHGEIKKRISSSNMVWCTRYIHPPSKCFYQVSTRLAVRSVTKIFNSSLKIGERENGEIKKRIRSDITISVYTIQPPNVQENTKFQLCWLHSYWEKCDENFHLKWLRNDRITDRQNHGRMEWRKNMLCVYKAFTSYAS